MIRDWMRLLRIRQWYKNLIIFLPLVFGETLFQAAAVERTVLGFLALCLVSSANYVINDIADREKDRRNPEKAGRPLASGAIRPGAAGVMATVLVICSVLLALSLSGAFLAFVLGLFLLTQLYTFWLKDEPFADILAIATNFVLRTVSGAFVIAIGFDPYVHISAWLLLCPFFLALFLASAKREAEYALLKEKAKDHRATLGKYAKETTRSLLLVSTTLLIASYALYTFYSPYPGLWLTLPFVLYAVFRFAAAAEEGSSLARHPEEAMLDARFLAAGAITGLIVLLAIYTPAL